MQACTSPSDHACHSLFILGLIPEGVPGYALKGSLHIDVLLGTCVKVWDVALATTPLLGLLLRHLSQTSAGVRRWHTQHVHAILQTLLFVPQVPAWAKVSWPTHQCFASSLPLEACQAPGTAPPQAL